MPLCPHAALYLSCQLADHRPNHSGTPPRWGSRLSLRRWASRSWSRMSSSAEPPSGLSFFSGNRSGNVKVCPCACGEKSRALTGPALRPPAGGTQGAPVEPVGRRGHRALQEPWPDPSAQGSAPTLRPQQCPCLEKKHPGWPGSRLCLAQRPSAWPFSLGVLSAGSLVKRGQERSEGTGPVVTGVPETFST